MRETLSEVRVDDGIIEYIADIVGRSRAHRSVYLGASPRASIGLLAVARALAASEGRDYVIPDDVQTLAGPCLAHRVSGRAGQATEPIIAQLVEGLPVPR